MAENLVLSKVKIGTTTYDLKDAKARSNLETLLGSHALEAIGAAGWLGVDSAVTEGGTGLVAGGAIKSYVDAQVGAIHNFDVVIAESLPTAAESTMYKIYMIADIGAAAGSYIEWITIRSGSEGSYTYAWEKIGSTKTDLSDYVPKTRKVAGVDLQDDITISELQSALELGDLAYEDTAVGSFAATTVSGVKATGTSTGSIDVVLDQTSTAASLTQADYTPAGSITGSAISGGSINVTVKDAAAATEATLTKGDYTPAGSVAITVDNNGSFQVAGTNAASAVTFTGGSTASVLGSIKDAAVAPSFTDGVIGSYTAAAIQTGFFTAGSAPSFSQGSKASLTAQTTSAFATEGMKVAVDTTDTEMLVFSAASTGAAVTDRGTFTANGDDTWNAGSMAAVDVTKFSGGAWSQGTFNAGSAMTFNNATVVDNIGTGEAAAQVFTGSKYAPSFSGTKEENLKVSKVEYLKQEIDAATFSGTAASLGFSGTKVENALVTAVAYDKASVNASGTKFNGASIELSVGDITVPAQDITVAPAE